MSIEDHYGPALKRARRQWLTYQESGKSAEYHQARVSMARHANNIALAQAEATAALVDEQRTANLIGVLQIKMTAYGWESDTYPALVREIERRLER